MMHRAQDTDRPLVGLISRRWWVIGLLSMLYVLSYIDRLILAILVEPLKFDLGISDTQIAILIGSTFGFLFALLSLPVAWLVDRGPRVLICSAGVLLWSLSTIASAFARNFEMLLVLRVGLAVSEAVLAPVAVSLIADFFSRRDRGLPTSVYVAAGIFGVMAAYAVGGGVVALVESGALSALPVIGRLSVWRETLILVGLPGLILGPLMFFTVREPARGRLDEAVSEAPTSQVGAFASMGDAVRFYVCFILGAAVIMMPSYAALTWYPTYLVRHFNVGLASSGYLFSISLGVGAVIMLGIPSLMRWLDSRGVKGSLVPIVLVGLPVGAGLFALSLIQSDLTTTIVLLVAGMGLLCGAVNGAPTVAVSITAPAAYRGRLVALNLATSNVIGLGLGPFIVAWLADHVFIGPMGLAQSLLALVLVATPVAWCLVLGARGPFRRASVS